jgi:predicted dienelactone hydrolase
MTTLIRTGTVALLACAGVMQAEKKPAAPLHVGVTTRAFHPKDIRNWRGDDQKDLRCAVWYPVAETAVETKQVVGPPGAPLFEAGMAATDAPPAKGVRPLILLSHGTGGSALQVAWLATALARSGFIVVAVDHPGNNSNAKMTPEGMALWWERATDLSQVLDGMLADSEFGKLVDKERVGAAGFSIGGFTVLQLAGAQTDIAAFFAQCHDKPDTAGCVVPEMKSLPAGVNTPADILHAVRKTSGESLARSGDLFSDDRVGAVFAIAPALAFTFTQESMRAIRLPVEMVVGDDDRIAPAKENAAYAKSQIRGAKLTTLPHVSHYTFLDTCTAEGKQKLERYCEDSAERDAVHDRVAGMAVAFFERALKVK